MVGWHLLLLLVIEVMLYGWVAWNVHANDGWGVPASIGLAIALYVGLRIVLVGIEFVVARRKGGAMPGTAGEPLAGAAGMYVRELAGWLMMFSVVLPFTRARHSVLDRPARASTAEYPVLLIHGLGCNRGNWAWFRRRLERRGHHVYTVDCTPPFARVGSYAPQVARAVDEILAATGAAQVVLIGHSMGGLVSRAYLDQYGDGKVRHVITLGTPHLGTWMTRLALGAGIRDMAEDSVWLTALREREAARSSQPYAKFTCIYTWHDNLVTPQSNAALPGAENIALAGIGHMSLLLSGHTVDLVLGVLERLADRVPGRAEPAIT